MIKQNGFTPEQIADLERQAKELMDHIDSISRVASYISEKSTLSDVDIKQIEIVADSMRSILSATTTNIAQAALAVGYAYSSVLTSVLRVINDGLMDIKGAPLDEILRQRAISEYNDIVTSKGSIN